MKFTIEMNIYELSRSIEAGTLEALVTDIKAHEDQVRNGNTVSKNVTATAPAPSPIDIPEPTQSKSEPVEDPKITEVQIRARFVKLSRQGKKNELKQLLNELGAEKVSDIKPEQYAEAWAKLEAM